MWDVAVVGGGSAGCVLANRLSEDARRRVLLIEAGRDLPPGQEGDAILDTYPGRAAFDPANHWPGLEVRTEPHLSNAADLPPARPYEQARLLGGGSSINGQVANRGTPADYDEWAVAGAHGWDWTSVLPYFIKVERDLQFDGPLHGKTGSIPIHRIPRERWPLFSLAAERALNDLGFDGIEDQNGVFTDGHFPMTLSNDGQHRVSTAMAYLDRTTRSRPNLRVMTDAQALTLVRQDGRVVGVKILRGDTEDVITARETVVAAGAIHSPAVLMRSGIGPQAHLRGHGIEVVADLPGVGRNLQEHPGISLSAYIRPHARLTNATRRHIHLGMRYSSQLEGCPASDMFMMVAAKSAWHPLGRRIGTIISWVNKAYSRGHVSLVAGDPRQPPTANLEYLADRRDLDRLKAAVRVAARMFATHAMSEVADLAGPSSYSGFAKKLGRRSARNFLLTAPIALAIDTLPAVRSLFFERAVASGLSLQNLLTDEDALEAYIRTRVGGQWHVCGTCRMGSADDREAVVDPLTGRVHGVPGLRVADASIMPTAPRANLNLPVIMAAEKMSDQIAASLD